MAKLPGQDKIPRAQAKRNISVSKFQVVGGNVSEQTRAQGMNKISNVMQEFGNKLVQVDALRQTTNAKNDLQTKINEIKNRAREDSDPDSYDKYRDEIQKVVTEAGKNVKILGAAEKFNAVKSQMGNIADVELQTSFYNKKVQSAVDSIKNLEVSSINSITSPTANRLDIKGTMFSSYDDAVGIGAMTTEAAKFAKRTFAVNASKQIFQSDLRVAGGKYAAEKIKNGGYDLLFDDVLEKGESLFSETEQKDFISKAAEHDKAVVENAKMARKLKYEDNLQSYIPKVIAYPEDFLGTGTLDMLEAQDIIGTKEKKVLEGLVYFDKYDSPTDKVLAEEWISENPIIWSPMKKGHKGKDAKLTNWFGWGLKEKQEALIDWYLKGRELLRTGAITKAQYGEQITGLSNVLKPAYEAKFGAMAPAIRSLFEKASIYTQDPGFKGTLMRNFQNLWYDITPPGDNTVPSGEALAKIMASAWNKTLQETNAHPVYTTGDFNAVYDNSLILLKDRIGEDKFETLFNVGNEDEPTTAGNEQ